MKKGSNFLVTAITVFALIIASIFVSSTMKNTTVKEKIVVGFIYDGDKATPYTGNFMRAENELVSEYGNEVEIHSITNVGENDCAKSLQTLVDDGCDIIFTNSFGFGETAKKFAEENPDIEFCQATCANANEDPVLSNYHTFMGEIYEGRYISGVLAGEKLNELISEGRLDENNCVIGYVGAFPYAEVISGYTSFFLGVRSVVPTAIMKVKYSNSWSDYALEKDLATELINEGCVLISQHSDTIGPAIACEEAKSSGKLVYHVGYNQSMINVAPTTSLVSTRINWNPYVVGAVEAVMNGEKIEDVVPGHVHGNDIGGGFDMDWVQVVEINDTLFTEDVEKETESLIQRFKSGNMEVFKGEYIGVDPFDSSDTIDLSKGYDENADCSAPSFHYILSDVIEIEE